MRKKSYESVLLEERGRWERLLASKSEQYIAERQENNRLAAANLELSAALKDCLHSMQEIAYGAMYRARKALGVT